MEIVNFEDLMLFYNHNLKFKIDRRTLVVLQNIFFFNTSLNLLKFMLSPP